MDYFVLRTQTGWCVVEVGSSGPEGALKTDGLLIGHMSNYEDAIRLRDLLRSSRTASPGG